MKFSKVFIDFSPWHKGSSLSLGDGVALMDEREAGRIKITLKHIH